MEEWVKQTFITQSSTGVKESVKQAGKATKLQQAHERATEEAGSETVNVDMCDGKVETPDVVNRKNDVTSTFFAPAISRKIERPVL